MRKVGIKKGVNRMWVSCYLNAQSLRFPAANILLLVSPIAGVLCLLGLIATHIADATRSTGTQTNLLIVTGAIPFERLNFTKGLESVAHLSPQRTKAATATASKSALIDCGRSAHCTIRPKKKLLPIAHPARLIVIGDDFLGVVEKNVNPARAQVLAQFGFTSPLPLMVSRTDHNPDYVVRYAWERRDDRHKAGNVSSARTACIEC
jgi:hypothetical protein